MVVKRIISEKQREALRKQVALDSEQEERIKAKLREIALRELDKEER